MVDALDPQPLVDAVEPLWPPNIETVGTSELAIVGSDMAFNMFNPAVTAHLENFAGDRIKDLINKTTRDELRATLVDGIRRGEGTRELRKRITDVFTKGDMNIYKVRAERIARTEVTRSSNFAVHTARKQSGVVSKKQWAAALVNTRATHAALHGTIKGLNEPFTIGLAQSQYPGNFGVPAEDVNCQCTTVAVIDQIPAGRSLKEFTDDQLAAKRDQFLALVAPWERDARAAFIRGFEDQMVEVLRVFDEVTG